MESMPIYVKPVIETYDHADLVAEFGEVFAASTYSDVWPEPPV